MALEEQLALAQQGYEVWNQWRKEHPDVEIDLSGADLRAFSFIRMNLANANLRGVNLYGVGLVDANLRGAILGEYYFTKLDLRHADLRSVTFDSETDLSGVMFDDETSLGDIQWQGADLTVVDWEPMRRLGDEKGQYAFPQIPIRAYRQVAAQLRGQGMNEYADRFAYRARICRRKLLSRQRKYGAVCWSFFLDILAGYGYYPQRCFGVYLVCNLCFASLYLLISALTNHELSPLGALVFSVTSFHGRGFFPGGVTLDDPLTVLAAGEAFVGLMIEASFIATFTERYFGDR